MNLKKTSTLTAKLLPLSNTTRSDPQATVSLAYFCRNNVLPIRKILAREFKFIRILPHQRTPYSKNYGSRLPFPPVHRCNAAGRIRRHDSTTPPAERVGSSESRDSRRVL